MTLRRRRVLHWSDGTIALDGPIRSDAISASALRRTLTELRDEPALRVMIQSEGGAVDEGLALYCLLRNAGKPVEVTVRWAASMAAVVAMAGTRIRIMEAGSFALHHVGMTPDLFELATGHAGRVTARHLVALGRDLSRIDEVHVDIIRHRTGLDRGTIGRLRDEETVIGAEEALRLGFADEVAGS